MLIPIGPLKRALRTVGVLEPNLTLRGGVVYQATITLTHAQLLTLPSTPVAIVAAPGAGKMLILERGVYKATIVTPYTDMQAYGYVFMRTAAGVTQSNAAPLTDLLVNDMVGWVTPAVAPPYDPFTNLVDFVGYAAVNNLNQAMVVACRNAIAIDDVAPQNLGGGHADNSLLVSIAYTIIDLTTGIFET